MINSVTFVFILIIGLFFIFALGQKLFKSRLCALCASISITWIFLLVLYWLGMFEEIILIAVLIGGSVVGLYYLVEEKTKQALRILRLPFFLTLVFLAYLALGINELPFLFMGLVWVLFLLLYFLRSHGVFKELVKTLISCCKKW